MHATPLPNLQILLGLVIQEAKETGRTLYSSFSMQELLSIAEALKDAARYRYVREQLADTVGDANNSPEEFDKWVDARMSKSNPVNAETPSAPST